MQYNISWEDTDSAYRTQMLIHNLLAAEYKKAGLEYGGRTLYTVYNKDGKHYDKRYGNVIKGDSVGFIPNSDGTIGYNFNYTKLVPEIHRKVLNDIYDGMVNPTEKHLLDMFNKINLNDGLTQCIRATDELIYDIRSVKDWTKLVKNIINNSKNVMHENVKNNKKVKRYRLTMNELVTIGKTILGNAIQRCPIETGFLRSSGRLFVHQNSIRIIFTCPYAVYVHENPNAVHPIGEYKFLEKAAQEVLADTSVWTETTGDNFVAGNYMKQVWVDGRDKPPAWIEQKGYNAVYIDIDRDLNVNYTH